MPGILLIQCADVTQTYHMESGVITALDHRLTKIHDHEFIIIRDIQSHLYEVIKTVIFVTYSPRIASIPTTLYGLMTAGLRRHHERYFL